MGKLVLPLQRSTMRYPPGPRRGGSVTGLLLAGVFSLMFGFQFLSNDWKCHQFTQQPSSSPLSSEKLPHPNTTPSVLRPIDAFPETSAEGGYCKHEEDVCPSIFLSLDQIWQQLNRTQTTQMSNFVLNVGANDGVNADPLFPLFERHSNVIGGVLVEPTDIFKRLKENYEGYKFAYLINEGVSPTNGAELCKRYFDDDQSLKQHAPYPTETKTMDVFKIDIDGCDCHVLEEMLTDPFYRAKVIQVETNHHIPPPIAYQDMCKDDVIGRGTNSLDIWGCSVQAAMDIVGKYGYELLQYDWPDAVFVHSDFRETFLSLLGPKPDGQTFIRNYYIGYHWAKENYSRFPWHQSNKDLVKSLVEMSTRAYMDPEGVLTELVRICEPLWTKNPLWSRIWIANTQYIVDAQVGHDVKVGRRQIGDEQ